MALTNCRLNNAGKPYDSVRVYQVDSLLEHLISAFPDAFDRGPDDDVRHDPDPLCFLPVRVKNADSAYHRTDSAGQIERRNVPVRPGCSAPDNGRSRSGAKGHRRIFGLAY